jgi:hypothetical protein
MIEYLAYYSTNFFYFLKKKNIFYIYFHYNFVSLKKCSKFNNNIYDIVVYSAQFIFALIITCFYTIILRMFNFFF